MTLDEFRSLKEGDKIEGMTGNVGTVSRIDESRNSRGRSVAIEWGFGGTPFLFNEHMTAWMHWSVVENDVSMQSEVDASGERINQVL